MPNSKKQTYKHDFSQPYFDIRFKCLSTDEIESNDELQTFLHNQCNIDNVEITDLKKLKERLSIPNVKKTNHVFLYVKDDGPVIINPFNSKTLQELPNNTKLLKISSDDYAKRLQPNIELQVNANSIMRDCLISGVSDGLWQSVGQIAISSNAIHLLGFLGTPFVLSGVCALVHADRSRRRFKHEHGRAPTAAEEEKIKTQALGFAFATGLAMFGWEAAVVGAKFAASLLSVTPHGMAIHVAMAMLTGIGQGIGAVIANAMLQYQGNKKINVGSLLTSFAQGFIAGTLWYGISMIPFGGAAAKVFGKALTTVAAMTTAFITSFATTLAVTATFQFAKSTIGYFWNKVKPSTPKPSTKKDVQKEKSASVNNESEKDDGNVKNNKSINNDNLANTENPENTGDINPRSGPRN